MPVALGVAVLAFAAGAASASAPTAEDLLVVDCLLPGQVRQLGARSTYVSARRPVKTTALDCRVRHGEYVLSDQASLATALEVWLDAAEAGDPEAQTTVGEIFERGMGVPPDHAAAAEWYRRAADAGYRRAQINLGHLFETGLGVPLDPRTALGWYRRAAGLDASIDLDTSPDVAPVALARERELERLRSQITRLEDDARQLTRQLDEARRLVELAPIASPEPAPLPPETLGFEEELARLTVLVAAREAAIETLGTELERARRALAAADAAVSHTNDELGEQGADLDAARAERDARARELQSTLAELDARSQALAERSEEVNRLRDQLEALRQAAPAARAATQAPTGDAAGPAIVLIDPQLPSTRGLVKVSMPAQRDVERIVGRVDAPAGLLTLTVNGRDAVANAAGVFVANILRAEGETDVIVTAIDQQGKRSDLRFAIAPASTAAAPLEQDWRDRVDFGSYHALLIGNNRYHHLPQLNSAINDVRRTAEVLRERYGFAVTVLENGTRYEILSALNELRARLTTGDNLLIYYAGHGELDQVNMRGHWLPVDAELENTANWLSNEAITDIINVMQAKQVLLIADSCYAGTLTRSSVAHQPVALTEQERLAWLKLMSSKRARVVLTSGGLAPVLDAGGGRFSVFARALIQVLETNTDVLEGRALFQGVAARVTYAAANFAFEQSPQFAPVARAGHEAGDFFLVPQAAGR